jgi:hypothetical protein
MQGAPTSAIRTMEDSRRRQPVSPGSHPSPPHTRRPSGPTRAGSGRLRQPSSTCSTCRLPRVRCAPPGSVTEHRPQLPSHPALMPFRKAAPRCRRPPIVKGVAPQLRPHQNRAVPRVPTSLFLPGILGRSAEPKHPLPQTLTGCCPWSSLPRDQAPTPGSWQDPRVTPKYDSHENRPSPSGTANAQSAFVVLDQSVQYVPGRVRQSVSLKCYVLKERNESSKF